MAEISEVRVQVALYIIHCIFLDLLKSTAKYTTSLAC